MKTTKRQLRRIINEEHRKLVREMNPGRTISADEDEIGYDLLASVEVQIDELIRYVKDEAERIGGGFRSPGISAGIRAEALKLMAEKIHGAR